MSISRSFNLKIKPLSDIHIGTGEYIMPYEYVIKDRYYYQIDPVSIFRNLNPSQKREFTIYAENDIVKMRAFVNRVYYEKMGYTLKLNVSDELKALYDSKLGGSKNKNEENQLQIKEMPNNEKGIFIPGSTIKGAIRGAYIEYMASNFGDKALDYTITRKDNKTKSPVVGRNKKDAKNIEKKFIETAFGCGDNGEVTPRNDPFRNIKISDSSSTLDATVKKLKMYSYSSKMDNFADSVPSYAQVIEHREDSKNDFLVSNFKIEKGFAGKTLKDIPLHEILYALDYKYKRMMDKDTEYYDDILANTRKNKDIIDEVLWNIGRIEEVYNEMTENQAIVRFGFGSGFNSTTFNLSSKSPAFVASRTLSEDIMPMGYALLDFEEII